MNSRNTAVTCPGLLGKTTVALCKWVENTVRAAPMVRLTSDHHVDLTVISLRITSGGGGYEEMDSEGGCVQMYMIAGSSQLDSRF
jgi:hypothetical protein